MTVEWKMEKEFVEPITGVVVRINVLEIPREPKHSVEVGIKGDDGRVKRFLQGEDEMEIAINLMVMAQEYLLGRRAEWLAQESNRLDRERDKRHRHAENLERRKQENRRRAGERGNGAKRKG